jgi:hypothetical protein
VSGRDVFNRSQSSGESSAADGTRPQPNTSQARLQAETASRNQKQTGGHIIVAHNQHYSNLYFIHVGMPS